ncbi:MAG TPA: hypothetical protein VEB21_14320 [Terriglobales bacterium]|nr:hypothetical protein [Terriglobales bacterium]
MLLGQQVSFKQHARAQSELPFAIISVAVGMAVAAAFLATFDYTITDLRYLIRF